MPTAKKSKEPESGINLHTSIGRWIWRKWESIIFKKVQIKWKKKVKPSWQITMYKWNGSEAWWFDNRNGAKRQFTKSINKTGDRITDKSS